MAKKKTTGREIVTTKDVKENIITADYCDEFSSSYIDYAMSVIAERALADVRDGLKPVQRRILYSMDELSLSPNSAYKKSARIVGDAMGKYHPHGDSSLYGGLVTMSKEWVYPYPLVDGHGNFGSIEGDGPAAMRYTEARLAPISHRYFFDDIDKDTVDFVPNFDETEVEPKLLPAKIPNLLLSGTEGIACGMAANIPSHNAGEVLDAVIAYMKNSKISIEKLMDYIQGPDFATGGVISNKRDLLGVYSTGSGKIRVRGKVEVEDIPGGRQQIVVKEIPQTMVGMIDKFMESVADLVRSKKAPDISDIKNMSSKEGTRIVIELKKGADAKKNLNLLYKKTRLEDTFGVNMLAIKDNQPKIYNLKELIQEFVEYQEIIYTRKFKFLLKKEEQIREVKEGLIRACDCIDLIIEILRGCKTKAQAKECLISGKVDGIKFKTEKSKKAAAKLSFTERQATAILSMQLSSLIGLELAALKKEFEACNKKIDEYSGYLSTESKMKKKIESDIKKIREELSKPRKTEIIDAEEIVLEKEEIPEEDMMLVIDRFGYAKLLDMPTYNRNADNVHTDYKTVIQTTNLDKLFVFTDSGRKLQIKCLDIPVSKYKDKGVPLENLSDFTIKERAVCFTTEKASEKKDLLFVTKSGFVKIVPGSEFVVSRKTIDATKFKDDNDKLIAVVVLDKKQKQSDLVLLTKSKMGLRFGLDEVSEMKKNSAGVVGMKLKDGDEIVFAQVASASDTVKYQEKEYKASSFKKQGRGTCGNKVTK